MKSGPNGKVDLNGTVKSAGLGGDPYRNGTYAYYIGEKTITNDPKGVGAFLLRAVRWRRNADRPSALRNHWNRLCNWVPVIAAKKYLRRIAGCIGLVQKTSVPIAMQECRAGTR